MSREIIRRELFPFAQDVRDHDVEEFERLVRSGATSRKVVPFWKNPLIARYKNAALTTFLVVHDNQVHKAHTREALVIPKTLLIVRDDQNHYWSMSDTETLSTAEGLESEIDFASHVAVTGLFEVYESYDRYMQTLTVA